MQIRCLNNISIYDPDRSYARTGYVRGSRAAQASCSYDQDFGGFESELACIFNQQST
jgi:hypothetical protein